MIPAKQYHDGTHLHLVPLWQDVSVADFLTVHLQQTHITLIILTINRYCESRPRLVWQNATGGV
jgi:hypothetical protein